MVDTDKFSPLTSLPYHEPSIVNVLILASFLLFINFARIITGRALGAGLLGEILIGVIYSAPLSSILPASVQLSLQSLGYLGLMLLIVEGGLHTRLDILTKRSNALLAICTASIGVILPIGFSFALLPPAFGFGWIESFACGAALASTSLGTVFSVIASTNSNMASSSVEEARCRDGGVSNPVQSQCQGSESKESSLADTRVGTILVGVALLDDIIGLVLSSVITNLSTGQPGVVRSLAPWTAAKPIVSSICLLLVSALLARFIISPLLKRHGKQLANFLISLQSYKDIAQWIQGLSLFIFIASVAAFASIASYIGSSNLIGCFCAGAFWSYLWQIFESIYSRESQFSHADRKMMSISSPHSSLNMILPVGRHILIPFFFASIGAAIPIKEMFVGSIVWKGFIYTGLMGAGKVLAGGCIFIAAAFIKTSTTAKVSRPITCAPVEIQLTELPAVQSIQAPTTYDATWPAALFLGLCLVARGEIGFLIINLAYQGGLIKQEAFLVSVWAITLNTIIGPASIGILLKTKISNSIEKGKWGHIQKID